MGASPTRPSLQLEATGAVMEVTKWLKPSGSVSRIGEPRLPLWVITGLGGPRPAASAVRGKADLQAKKADIAARRSAFRGKAVGPAAWPEQPLVANS